MFRCGFFIGQVYSLYVLSAYLFFFYGKMWNYLSSKLFSNFENAKKKGLNINKNIILIVFYTLPTFFVQFRIFFIFEIKFFFNFEVNFKIPKLLVY